jgi:acyl carrier protein
MEHFLAGRPVPGDDTDLLTLLDSLQLLRLVSVLEGKFGIKVDNSELAVENLGTLNRIAAFVVRKQAEPTIVEGLDSQARAHK